MTSLRWFGKRAVGMVVVAMAVMGAYVMPAAAGAAPVPQGFAPPPGCAWQLMSNSTDLNVAFPDTGASYWILPYALGAGDSITLNGRYPEARYFSLNTYGTDFNTIDTLRDAQIAPDRGGVNPYATIAPANAARGGWTARVVNGRPNSARNELRGVRPGQSAPIGFLILRVYVPDDAASPSGGVVLPTVTFRIGGLVSTLPPCAVPFNPSNYSGPIAAAGSLLLDKVIASAAADAFSGNGPEGVFVAPASTSGLFPNGDNKYIGARLSYRKGRVLVVRGRAPSFPDTRSGVSPATAGKDVRYWSMCQNDLVSPYPVVACALDAGTRLDASGFYTYVVAAPADFAASSADSTLTVIPWGSTTVDKVVFLRNMLPSNSFYPRSVQAAVRPGVNAPASMGDYYPRSTYCDADVLRSSGWQGCFA